MFDDTCITIMTRGRLEKQKTWACLADSQIAKYVDFCTTPEERGALVTATKTSEVWSTLAHAEGGSAAVREACIQRARANGYRYLILLDDDVRFQRRRENGRITNCTAEEVPLAFEWMREKLSQYAHVGMATRFALRGTSDSPRAAAQNSRVLHVVGLDLRVLEEYCLSPLNNNWRGLCMPDFHLTLQLLRSGFPSLVSHEWRVDPGATNAPGGVSYYRSAALMQRSAARLAIVHAPFVELRQKDVSSWKNVENVAQTDVKVAWNAAWRSWQKNPYIPILEGAIPYDFYEQQSSSAPPSGELHEAEPVDGGSTEPRGPSSQVLRTADNENSV